MGFLKNYHHPFFERINQGLLQNMQSMIGLINAIKGLLGSWTLHDYGN